MTSSPGLPPKRCRSAWGRRKRRGSEKFLAVEASRCAWRRRRIPQRSASTAGAAPPAPISGSAARRKCVVVLQQYMPFTQRLETLLKPIIYGAIVNGLITLVDFSRWCCTGDVDLGDPRKHEPCWSSNDRVVGTILHNKVVVVTGEGERNWAGCLAIRGRGRGGMVVADINADGARRVADEVHGLAVPTDVALEADLIHLRGPGGSAYRDRPLCSNAGIYASAASMSPMVNGKRSGTSTSWPTSTLHVLFCPGCTARGTCCRPCPPPVS